MRIEPLGDLAAIIRDLPAPAHAVAASINENPPSGVIEAVASYDTVGVYFERTALNRGSLECFESLRVQIERIAAQVDGAGSMEGSGRTHSIPVCYEMGEDMESVCAATGLSADEVARHHSAEMYRCYAVGFCPGFPYLGYLPEPIQGLPRLSQPRPRVAPGSVGITGRQTGVYPLPRPGGWQLIGRTPLVLVDVATDYFPIVAGDFVRFERIDRAEFDKLEGERL